MGLLDSVEYFQPSVLRCPVFVTIGIETVRASFLIPTELSNEQRHEQPGNAVSERRPPSRSAFPDYVGTGTIRNMSCQTVFLRMLRPFATKEGYSMPFFVRQPGWLMHFAEELVFRSRLQTLKRNINATRLTSRHEFGISAARNRGI